MNVKAETYKHKRRVAELMSIAIKHLITASVVHDDSKLNTPEAEIFEEYTPKLAGVTYGSDEYKEYLKEMKVIYRTQAANFFTAIEKLKQRNAKLKERNDWFDNLVEYKVKGKYASLKEYVESLENKIRDLEAYAKMGNIPYKEAIALKEELSRMKKIGVEEIEELVHKVYIDLGMHGVDDIDLAQAIHTLYNGDK